MVGIDIRVHVLFMKEDTWQTTCLTLWPHNHLTCWCRRSNLGRSG